MAKPFSLRLRQSLSLALFAAAAMASSSMAAAAEAEQRHDPIRAHIELGVSYYQDGRFDIAQEEALAALKDDSSNSDALTLLGAVHLALGEIPQAESAFRKAVSSNPQNANARNNLGQVLCQTRRHEEGIEQFGRALATPRYPQDMMLNTLINAGICLASKPDLPAAERYFLKALQEEPFYPPALYQLANLYYKTNRFAAAESRIEALHKQTAPTAATLYLQAQIAQAQSNHVLARELAAKLLLQFPKSPEAKKLRGD